MFRKKQRNISHEVKMLMLEDQLKKELRNILKQYNLDLEKHEALKITLDNLMRTNYALRIARGGEER